MRISRQPACILHVRPWRETSLLLECLCRDHGRIGLLARGARNGRGRLQRAMLEPFQDLEIDCSGRGELATLGRVEPVGPPRRLAGTALYAGLYLNELLVRMLARYDPCAGLLERYRAVLDALADRKEPAWALRCFERDLLAILGYALELRRDVATGSTLDAEGEYAYLPEQGPQAWVGQDGVRVLGADLLALAGSVPPDAAGQERLRRLMRHLIGWHAPAGTLKSWELVAPRHAAD